MTSVSPTQQGFSLLEVIVALLILSAIGAIMSGFLVQLRQLDRHTQQLAVRYSSKSTIEYLARSLSSAQKIPLGISTRGIQSVFSGDATTVDFVGPVRISSSSYALRHIQFSFDSELTRTVQKTKIALSTDAGTELQALGAPISELTFQYRDRRGNWESEWQNTRILPSAVRIRLRTNKSPNTALTRIAIIDNAQPVRQRE